MEGDARTWIALAVVAAAWLSRIVQSEFQGRENAKRNTEINDKLDAIVIQTNKTNGTVGRHDEVIEMHGREIERIRNDKHDLRDDVNRALLGMETRIRKSDGK